MSVPRPRVLHRTRGRDFINGGQQEARLLAEFVLLVCDTAYYGPATQAYMLMAAETSKSPQFLSPRSGRRVEANSGGDFIEVARELRSLHDTDRGRFHDRARELGLNRRKSYYLVRIDKEFGEIGADPDLMRQVGWTKLGVLAPHVTRQNWKGLLRRALDLNVHELQAELAEGPAQPKNQHIALRMTKDQKAVFDAAIEAYSQSANGGKPAGKAAAITAALRVALKAVPGS